MDEVTINAYVGPPNSFQVLVLFVCCCFYLHVCLIDCCYNVLSFSFFFLFISNNCSFNVYANIEASSSQSMAKTNPVPRFDQLTPL